MSDTWKGEAIKATLYFDNNTSYEVYYSENAPDDKHIVKCSLSEQESTDYGNPLGVASENSCTLSIFDINNSLINSNTNSEFFGYMRNGVKVELQIEDTDNNCYVPYGVYYVSSWSTAFSNGLTDTAEISACDKLQYLGNKDIPKLPVYSGLTLDKMLKVVFNSLGITDEEYIIDERLNTKIVFGVTVGEKVREFLNSVAQALIAHITVDRRGIIRIVPALKSYGKTYTILDKDICGDIKSEHNESNMYNSVKVTYNKLSEDKQGELISINDIELVKGINKLVGIRLNNKALDIENIYIDTPYNDTQGNIVEVTGITWSAYQDGIDITCYCNTEVSDCSISVFGKVLSETEYNELVNIEDTGYKYDNTLEVVTTVVQDRDTANKLANNVAEYLKHSDKRLLLDTMLTPLAEVGDTIIINSIQDEFNGNYKLIESDTDNSSTYQRRITLIKISDIDLNYSRVWDDKRIWDDEDTFLD